MSITSTSLSKNSTAYFGYGSNLWRHQMRSRCPTSEYLGIARLNNFRWIINERGYANVVQIPHNETSQSLQPKAYEDEVWGLVYTLYEKDEARLDRNEGVPVAYTKELVACDFWEASGATANIPETPKEVSMLVYINRNQTEPSAPKHEYIYRMNMGIKDALKEGVPKGYVDKVMRPFIPDVGE
jgi:gamma-glutamylcyclotransferase